MAALTVGKTTSVAVIVNTRNKAIAVAVVLLLEIFILFSSPLFFSCAFLARFTLHNAVLINFSRASCGAHQGIRKQQTAALNLLFFIFRFVWEARQILFHRLFRVELPKARYICDLENTFRSAVLSRLGQWQNALLHRRFFGCPIDGPRNYARFRRWLICFQGRQNQNPPLFNLIFPI